tara:strand:- start:1429 stop:1824 length:396 start_codon:yes stop_codon:yes gene_type:complete
MSETAQVEHDDVALKLHQENEQATADSTLGEDAAVGINEGLTGARVGKLLQTRGQRTVIDASTLTAEDMDVAKLDQLLAEAAKKGATIAFGNASAELLAANKGFFDAVEARGIAVTSDHEAPEEAELEMAA